MRFRIHSRIKTLDAWLAAATRGLCDDARERIAEEVASHYEEALNAARAEGLAEDAAIAQAVRSLGSPRKARRRLRREHLTVREARAVLRMQGEYVAASRIWDIPPLPRKTIGIVVVVIGLPFLLLGSILGVLALNDTNARATVIDALPVIGMFVFLAFISVSMICVGRFSHKKASSESIGKRARRIAFSKGVWGVLGFLLTFGLVITEIPAWHLVHESYEGSVTAKRESTERYEHLKSHPLPPPTEDAPELYKSSYSAQESLLRSYENDAMFTPEPPKVDWMFFYLLTYFGGSAFVNLTASIWHARFASKLQRLGYTDPPSASC